MAFAVGDQVRLKDGRSGSVTELTQKTAIVTIAVEEPHPTRPDRLLASLTELEIPKGDLEPWTLEHEAELQVAERKRAQAEWERVEKIRRAQVDRDDELEALVRGKLSS